MKRKCASGFCKSQHSTALESLPGKSDVFSGGFKVSLKPCASKVRYCFIAFYFKRGKVQVHLGKKKNYSSLSSYIEKCD